MSAFYVGQRVRVNCRLSTRHGAETFVTAIGVQGYSLGVRFIGIEVALLNRVNGIRNCIFEHHELEPILPEGLESLDRINELYEPEPEVIRV